MPAILTRRTVLAAFGAALVTPPRALAAADGGCLAGLLSRRRMVRRFTEDPVGDTLVDELVRAATRAPSAGNTQPWAFVVVRDRERRAALGRAALGQMFVAQAPVVIAACADVARSRARYGERGERYATIDTAFASLCLMLAATERGLGACFVGAFDDADVSRILALPSHVRPLAVIPVGYPAEKPGAAKLRPLRDVISRERFTVAAEPSRSR